MSTQDPRLGPTPATRLFRLLHVVSARLRVLMDRQLAPLDLTTQQAAVLTIVAATTPPPTLGALGDQLSTSHQNVRQLVDVLVRKGLVEVRVDPDDRRSRRVVATARVEAVFAPRDAVDQAELRTWFGGLSDDELEVAVELLWQAWRGLPGA